MQSQALRRRWRDTAAVAAVLVALVCASGCGGRGRGGGREPIKIGVLADFNTPDGDGIRNGVAMAVEEINAGGGVLGRPLEVVAFNTDRSPAKVVQGYQRLAGFEHVAAVIGISTSAVFGVMPLLSQYEVPLVCTGAGADRLTDMVAEDYARYKYFFRVMHKSSELGEAVSDYVRGLLYGRLGMRRFAIMVEDDIWTRNIRDMWERTIRSLPGAQVVYSGTFSPETQDFVPLLTQIMRQRPDYILDAASAVDATTYIKQWAELRGPPMGAIPTGAGTRRYFEELGSRGIGIASVATIPSAQNPLTPGAASWWSTYQARFGDPEYTSAYSYDAMHLLRGALAASGGTGPDSLRAALEHVHYAGIVGNWRFGRDHHPAYGVGLRWIPVVQYYRPVPEGYRVIWPANLAAGPFLRAPLWPAPSDGRPRRQSR